MNKNELREQEIIEGLWEKFLKLEPDNYDLWCMIINAIPLREMAGCLLLKRSPNNRELCDIIRYVISLREESWEKLLQQNPTSGNLRYISKYVESLREKAETLLAEKEPDKNDLENSTKYLESMIKNKIKAREEALARKKKRLEDEKIAKIISAHLE